MAWTTEDRIIGTLLFAPEKAEPLIARGLPGRNAAEDPRVRPPDWPSLVEKAGREGVAAALFHNIRAHLLEALVPTESLEDLSGLYYANLKRNLTIAAALRPVLDALAGAAVPCIVLKGIALAERVYPSIAIRGMSDVDLLVRKDDLQKADACLSALDYAPLDSTASSAIHNPAGYLASLEYGKDPPSPLNLHLHWHPVNTSVPASAFIEGIDLDRIWEKAVPVPLSDSRALMLCPEHLIACLCEHALRVGHSFDRLILVCDIYFAIRRCENGIDWDDVAAESRRIGLHRFAWHGLEIVRGYTDLPIPQTCLAQLKPPDLTAGERLFLRLQRDNRRIRGSSYFVYLALNRGLFAKTGLFLRTLFPPGQILRQRSRIQHSEVGGFNRLSRTREVCSQVMKLILGDYARPDENRLPDSDLSLRRR